MSIHFGHYGDRPKRHLDGLMNIKRFNQELLSKLSGLWWKLCLLTGNQRWNANEFATYWLEIIEAKNGQEKANFMSTINAWATVAIWNARIDIWMFEKARISIATIQWEWIHAKILKHVDLIVYDIDDALMMFVDANRFAATMKI